MIEMWAGRGTPQAAPAPTEPRRRSALGLLAVLLLVVCSAAAAVAQTAKPPSTPTPAQSTADTLSPGTLSSSQAQGALAVLRDDKRRAELIATLEAIARAAPAPEAAGKPSADTPATAAAKPATAAMAPDSVGAQLAGRMSIMLGADAQQLALSVQSVNDLPLLWRWLASQAGDPDARAAVLDAAKTLLLVLAGGLLGEFVVRRILRRLRATLVTWSPRHDEADVAIPSGHETEVRRRRFDRILGGLRLLPYLFGRLVLDLLPTAAFLAIAELLVGTVLGTAPATRLVVLQAVEAYTYARVILAGAAFLFSPEPPRLLAVTDWAAEFLTRWLRRLVIIAVSGFAIGNIGLLFGMYHTAQLAILKLFALVVHLCLVVAVLQVRVPVAHRLHARRGSTGLWATLCSRFADIWHYVAIFFIVALWLVWAVEVRNGYERLLGFFGVTVAILVVARLVAVLILGGLDRLRAMLAADGLGDRAGVYYPFLRAILSAAIWFVTGVALLEAWGLPLLFWVTAGGLGARVLDALITIVVAVLVAVAAWEMVNAAVARHLSHLSTSAQLARAGRLRTLLPLLRTALLVTIVLMVGMIALSAIGVNIAPLLAGAGVLGIAVGFGSQKLVQDFITGLFILLENAIQVGDVVTLAGMTGTVEALSVRTIRLRALDGAVHLIPFSSVSTVTNQTRDYSYAVLDISIGLNEAPDRVEQVMREVAADMQADPAWQSILLDKMDILGVQQLTDTAWILRVRIKAQPSSRWSVSRELNRRVKVRFDELAIESPFTSHRVLSREVAAPAVVAQADQAA